MTPREGASPGEALLGAAPIAALLLILWNDFWLRVHHPGFWSGKLSDVGICFLFPVLVSAIWEWSTWVVFRLWKRSWRPPSFGVHALLCALCATYYGALELWPLLGLIHQRVLTTLCPFWRFRSGTADPTDLLALVMTPLALWYLRRRATPRPLQAPTGTPP